MENSTPNVQLAINIFKGVTVNNAVFACFIGIYEYLLKKSLFIFKIYISPEL